MSVVNQRAWLEAGFMRRFLLRAVLVLGGAFVVTVLGWLLSTGSADAAELPSLPTIPLVAPVLPAVSPDALTAAPKKIVDLSTSDLRAIGAQAHAAVTAIGARVVPVAAPAGSLLPPVTRVVPVVRAPQALEPVAAEPAVDRPSVRTAASMAPAPPRTRQLVTVVPVRHAPTGTAPSAIPAQPTASPNGTGHNSPLPAPLRPAGSPDSNAHGAAGPAGGSGGAQVTFAHPLGDGLALADTPNTPRLTAGPGDQPGTSPD